MRSARLRRGLISLLIILLLGLAGWAFTQFEPPGAKEVEASTPKVAETPPPVDPASMYAQYIQEFNYKVFPELATLIAEGIYQVGKEFEMPPEFLLALAQVESSFNYYAVSNADCIGLLQINPKVWIQDQENVHNLVKAGILTQTIELYDPLINLRAGAHVFKVYYKAALKNKNPHPLKYATTRYFGGEKNAHYQKFGAALGDFLMFKLSI